MQAIIAALCLMITFWVGYSAGDAVAERDELKLAMQYQAKVEVAEQNLIIQSAQIEVAGETALADFRARYDSLLKQSAKTVYVYRTTASAAHCEQAASSDGLPERVGGIEVSERDILGLMQAADEQTQSLMACQIYVDIVTRACNAQ